MRANRHANSDDLALQLPALRQLSVLLLLWIFSFEASAQDSIRIGYVDMKQLFETAPQVVAARNTLDDEFRPRNESLLADENRLIELEQTLAESSQLDSQGRLELERDIRNLRRSIDRRREDLREELRFRTSTATKALEETIEVAVRQVAEERGFDLILTSPVAYASDNIDITDFILAWLERDFNALGNDG
ncbi:MAG: OmpH family outer membrane protein [Wenzhouxiangella sp.]|jgi:outer membrane protein|nr:OmpH family outer membrane protein [Wenzhouxiangella sp.]